MTAHTSLKKIIGSIGGLLASFMMVANVQAAATPLATEPFLSSTAKVKALPNIMFVLDDSGSMNRNYLPDWAGPYLDTDNVTVLTPAHRFYNGIYNGVAYNPGTRYRPPSMYTNTGALDTTTYSGQTGVSVATGGDGSATALLPNWRAVKVDGYGVQSTATVNLEGNAFSYTTVAGEYCDTAQLRNCVASTTPTGSYTFPSKLRWCTTAALAIDTTANANGFCQASNIDDTATNIANGVTPYIYPRIPRPSTATITVTAGTVSGITVGGLQILSAGAASAAAVATNINACTLTSTGACTVVGFSAVSLGNVVTVTAPNGTTATMVPAGGTTSGITAFSNGNVPGSSLFTVITPSVTSYVFPGTAAKGANRTDCADLTYCTYAEEMINYANWHAYYRTRMEMMKTSASIAFSNVTDQFRVGYYSINNGRYNHDSLYKQFLNVSAFDGAQKYSWYSTFLNAYPFGATPLRTSLAATGQMYAGKKATMNLSSVVDPVEYSCQQNYTILSTDGYWFGEGTPTQIDGTTPIGQQDGSLDRPYYDGGTQTRTTSQTLQSFQQKMMNTFFVDSRTSQLQTSTSRLSKAITTTTTQPWKLQNSQLQARTQQLNTSTYALESRTYPLIATTKELREYTFNPQSTTRPLEKSTFMLTETSTPLKQTITKITSMTYLLQVGTEQTIATTTPLQKGTQATYATTTPLQTGTRATFATTTPLQKGTQATYATTTPLQKGTQATFATTTPLQKGTQGIYATVSPLQSSTYKLQSVNFQLQKSMETSSDGGDSWVPTGWVNVTSGSCETRASGPGYVRNTTCRYNPTGTTTGITTGCTTVTQSPSSPFTVLVASTCSYETTPTVASVGNCTAVGQSGSPYMPSVSCAYGTAAAAAPAATCIANDQSATLATLGTLNTGDKVVCSVAATPTWANSGTCSAANQNYAAGTGLISCRYDPVAGNTTVSSAGATCNAKDQTSSLATLGAAISGDKVVCSVAPAVTWANSGSCTAANPVYASGTAQVSCRYYSATTPTAVAGACAANDQTGTLATLGTANTGDKVACSVATTPTWANSASCTAANPVYASGTGQISCRYYSATTPTAVAGACAANDQTGTLSTLGTANTGDKVVCSVAATPTWTNSATCTPANPVYSTGTAQTSCRYNAAGTTVSAPGATCVGNDQTASLGTIGALITGNQVVCSLQAVNWVNATGTPPTCTPAAANFATGASQISCRYNPTADATKTLTNQSVCTPYSQPTNAPMSGNQVTCAYQAPSAATTVTSCQWTSSATFETQKVTCAYDSAANTSSGALPSCSVVAQSTGTTEGTTWSGPSKACAYRPAVVASNQPNCTSFGSASSPPNYSYYETCGYGTAVVTSASSCAQSLPEAGPNYASGSTVACTYLGTPSSTSAPLGTIASPGSCTFVAPSATWAAPAKTCAYDAAATSTVTACTDRAESTGGAGTYTGPSVSCAYQGAASATNLNAPSCSANRQVTSPYTGPAIDCAFNATPVVTTPASCTTKNEAGPSYTGAKVSCAYAGSFGSWSDVTSGSCDAADQSAATGPTYGVWKECKYDPRADTYAGTCTGITASSSPTYSVRNPVVCVPGSYVTSSVTAAATIVDACAVGTVTTGDVNGGPPTTQTDVATACTYAGSPTVASATSCTEHLREAVSPYTTEVTCPYTTGGWVRATTTAACAPVGTQPPPGSMVPADFVGGLNVECRTTEPASAGTGTVASPVTDPSCTVGLTIDGTNKQTNCVLSIDTTPTPVDPTTCTATVGLPTGPDYIKQICTTSAPAVSVSGCSPLGPTSPLWQTVTCVEDPSQTALWNTLADTAAYYYKTDLRTNALNNCTAASGETLCSSADDALPLTAAATGDPVSAYNNVPSSITDPNKFQHMVTFTLGLGASGYMKFSDMYATDATGDYPTVKGVSPYAPANGIAADPGNGVCSWQATGNCNWPVPAENEQTTIDDLWHAGVNGHGAYFSATDPVSLSNSITSVLNSVGAAGGATAAPAISNASLSPGDNFLWSSTYTSLDWTGELTRRQLDPYTGGVSSTVDWAVQAKLDAKLASARNIYTFDSSVASTKLKAFTSANFAANAYFLTPNISTSPNGLTQFLCASTDVCLSATNQDTSHAAGANLVNFLRGDRTYEGTETDNTKYYRQRAHILGDMVNAQAVYVNVPNHSYADAGYGEFVEALTATPRQAAVYAGANDGMVHAFAAKGSLATESAVTAAAVASSASALDPLNASLATAKASTAATAEAALAVDAVVGQELWAYIPTAVMPNLYKLADKRYKDQHRYYVDATPAVGDICTANCTVAATADWRTILVGGLARGGRSYYALDVTDPATPKALWEFTDDNLGYTYGNPQIAKMSDGTWVVLVASGYNNIPNEAGAAGDGVGRLYVLNATTGALIRSISTGVGSASNPSGLAKITAQVVNPTSDATVEAVYGGDLLGNLWRFDINNTVGATGYDAQLLAVLKDGSGNVQPITTKPQVGLEPKNSVKVVYVGTGRFLDPADVTDVSQQSFYAIKDVRATSTTPATAIFDNPGGGPRATSGVTSSQGFVRQVQSEISCPVGTLASICAQGETIITSTNYPVDFVYDNGWVIDLIHSAERNNTDPGLDRSTVVFNTNAPSLAACDIGGNGYGYFLNYLTGGPNYSPGNGVPALNNGLVGKLFGNTFISAPTLVITKSGEMISIFSKSDGSIGGYIPPRSNDSGRTRRTAWRELIRE